MQLGIGADGPIRGSAGRRHRPRGGHVLRRRRRRALGRACCTPPVVGGGCRDFDPSDWFGPKEARQLDRFAQFSHGRGRHGGRGRRRARRRPRPRPASCSPPASVASTPWPTQVGVYNEKGPDRVSPRLVPMMMANAGAAGISMRLGWRRAVRGDLHRLRRRHPRHRGRGPPGGLGPLRRRRSAAAAEAGMHPVAHRRLRQHDRAVDLGQLTPVRRPPRRLRHDRRGRARWSSRTGTGPWPGAPPSTPSSPARPAPPTPTTSPPRRPTGRARSPAWNWPWPTPASRPADVGHINAHGTSTPLNDLAEAHAIAKVFGEPGPLVTSTKGVTGHGLAAAGAIEAVAAVLTIDHATIPPTAGYERARPRDHDPTSCTASRGRGSPRPSCRTRSASAATTAAW